MGQQGGELLARQQGDEQVPDREDRRRDQLGRRDERLRLGEDDGAAPVAPERVPVRAELRRLQRRAWQSGASFRDPQFRTAVARLAAPIHGKEMDELVGEDIKQHQRARRLARAAVATLLVSADRRNVAAAILAYQQRNTANERARIARSRELAASSEGALSTAPAAALADGVKAIETSRTHEAGVTLRRAILANPMST